MAEYVTLPRADVEIVTQIANRNEQSAAGDRLAVMLSFISASLTADAAELVERLENGSYTAGTGYEPAPPIQKEAASFIQSQAARIAELEAGLRRIIAAPMIDHSDPNNNPSSIARALLNRRVEG